MEDLLNIGDWLSQKPIDEGKDSSPRADPLEKEMGNTQHAYSHLTQTKAMISQELEKISFSNGCNWTGLLPFKRWSINMDKAPDIAPAPKRDWDVSIMNLPGLKLLELLGRSNLFPESPTCNLQHQFVKGKKLL